jgi:hypothetical protein
MNCTRESIEGQLTLTLTIQFSPLLDHGLDFFMRHFFPSLIC